MSEEPIYDDWIANRRSTEVSTDLTDRVLVAIETRQAMRQRLLLLRLAHCIDRSLLGRWVACLVALSVGSTPFVVFAYVARLFVN